MTYLNIEEKKISLHNNIVTYYYLNNLKINSTSLPSNNIIFLHGWMSKSQIWFNLIDNLDISTHLYTLDLPGFGKSQMKEDNFNLNKYVDIVNEFIQKLKLENVILIGHSNGGSISIKLVNTYPNTIKKLVLVNSAGIRERNMSLRLMNIFAKSISPIFKLKLLSSLRRNIYKVLDSEDYLESKNLKNTYLNIINEDLTPLLNKINTPTLIFSGTKDKATPLRYAKLMNEKIKNSKLIVLNAGHFSFLDQPIIFKEKLKEFLKI